MVYRNCWTDTLYFAGVAYPPGSEIPETVDPAQLAHFAAQRVVEPTAPVPDSHVAPGLHLTTPEEEIDGDYRSD